MSNHPLEPAKPGEELSYTIDEWCAKRKYSRPTYHKLQRLGLGPKELTVLRTKRITIAADREWEEMMMKRGASEAVRLEQERRTAIAKQAGAKAKASPAHISKTGKKRRAA